MEKLTNLKQIKGDTRKLTNLNSSQIKDLQTVLKQTGDYFGNIDGLVGDKTRFALKKFKKRNYLEYPDVIGTSTVNELIESYNDEKELVKVKSGSRDDVIEAIIQTCEKQNLPFVTQKAYILATVEHETNNTFEPVREAYWLDENWRKENLRYYPYYGRGFCQLTWENNYQKYEEITGYPLVDEPDRVMDYDLSVFICVHGMKNGIFTGNELEKYVNSRKTNYYYARKVVNGLDKAKKIANLAKEWERKLRN